jgi:hypothetical protein
MPSAGGHLDSAEATSYKRNTQRQLPFVRDLGNAVMYKKESGGRYPNGFASLMKQTDELCAAVGSGRRLCITLQSL